MVRRLLLVFVAIALVAPACGGSDDDTGRGYRFSADQLTAPRRTADREPAGDWEVTVATAVVPEVVALAAPPPELGVAGSAFPTPVEGKPLLGPIPGFDENATSKLVEGGWAFYHPTFFGNPLVFVVTADHGDWLEVMVPTRPNGLRGWIRASDVTLSTHEFHAQIDVSDHWVKVWNGDEVVVDTSAVMGKDTSPTPLGEFYFNEKIQKFPTSAFGSWIFSTNAYSDTLETFDGGLPVFAVHGTNQPDQVGQYISNGCVRIPNEAIEKMAEILPMGTPITVVA